MDYKNLLYSVDENNIATLIINRPKAYNAINAETMGEIGHFFSKTAPKLKGIVGVVVTGAGDKAFVAGADIKAFLTLDNKKAQKLSKQGHLAYNHIENFDKPVIAAVNGFALGGGCELAMACHMRIAGAKAKFGQPEVNLGIVPGYGGSQRLVQLIGKGKAMELLLTGDMIGAEEAHRLGLANHVVPQGEEIAKAKEILLKIATKGPISIAKTIELVNLYFNKKKDGFKAEIEAFGACADTKDFKEGASAFIEKRKANFTGK